MHIWQFAVEHGATVLTFDLDRERLVGRSPESAQVEVPPDPPASLAAPLFVLLDIGSTTFIPCMRKQYSALHHEHSLARA